MITGMDGRFKKNHHGKMVALLVLTGGCMIFGVIGLIIIQLLDKELIFIIPSCLVIIWLTVYFAVGFMIAKKQEYLVIERLGKFYRIAHDGPRLFCLPGLIDKIRK
ncbi:hypothetical protein COV23_02250, partial [Candidatus Wolfebacteria bacterium CG10_big_fil_rev_8_21_14_0_10_31_9]